MSKIISEINREIEKRKEELRIYGRDGENPENLKTTGTFLSGYIAGLEKIRDVVTEYERRMFVVEFSKIVQDFDGRHREKHGIIPIQATSASEARSIFREYIDGGDLLKVNNVQETTEPVLFLHGLGLIPIPKREDA